MVLEIDKNDELARVLDEDAATHRVVVVDASCVVQGRPLDADAQLGQPRPFFLLDAADLIVLTAELTENLDDAPLDLEFGLASHQWAERHASEVASHRDLQVVHLLGSSVDPL